MKITSIKTSLFGIVFLTLLSTPLWIGANDKDFAKIQNSGSVICWTIDPHINYESIELKLSSGDYVKESKTDATPCSSSLDDGGYNYELVVTPALDRSAQKTKQETRTVANEPDGRDANRTLASQRKTSQHGQVQSGFFTISGGQLVSADTKENSIGKK